MFLIPLQQFMDMTVVITSYLQDARILSHLAMLLNFPLMGIRVTR